MGLTQHKHSVPTLQEIVNLLLIRGMIGKPGAGVCPVRGHSNVQGDRTMGIWELMPERFLAALDAEHGITSPRAPGYDTVGTLNAMAAGDIDVFIGAGRQLRRRDPGHRGHRGRAAPGRADGADLHQAEPVASGARPGRR